MTAIAAAQDTIDTINGAIAQTAKIWIARGADPQRAVRVATEAMFAKLEAEAPRILASYRRAQVLLAHAAA